MPVAVIALLVIAAICVGVGFVIKWLFIAAVIAVVVAAVMYFAGAGRRTRTRR